MKIYLVTIGSLILVSAALIYHITNIYDPETASNTVFISLFFALTIFLTTVISLLLFWLKINFLDRFKIISSLAVTLRQSFLLSSTLIILLVLKILNVFLVWEVLSIIMAFIFLELFFQSEKKNYQDNN